MRSAAALTLVAIGLIIAQRSRAAIPPPYATNTYYPYIPVPENANPATPAPLPYDAIDTFIQPWRLPWEQPPAMPDDAITNVFNASSSVVAPEYSPIRYDDYSMNTPNPNNINAFLSVIRQIESQNNYNALALGGTFSDFSDHPTRLGWTGARRQDGRVTTAAGAYQITRTTWDEIRKRLQLPDFSPASQDAAAVAITQFPWRQNAYNDIVTGNFLSAVGKLRNEWESLGRILAHDYVYTLPQITQMYADAGGTIAKSTYA